MNFKKIKSWIPLTALKPLPTFKSRLILKLLFIHKTLYKLISLKLRRTGARSIGTSQTGNALMYLNRGSVLGKKGFVVELAKDEVIFNQIRLSGSWEPEISVFLAQGLERISLRKNHNSAMIDIGANCGLISLQTINISESTNDFFLIEPLPKHLHALRNNLRTVSKNKKIHIFEIALSDKNGSTNIYTEVLNQGNTTTYADLIPSDKYEMTEIFLSDTERFCEKFLSVYSDFVIKSDTQGMDALILSRIPAEIWQKVECAVVEIWAVPGIQENDINNLLAMWGKFSVIEWSNNSSTERSRVNLDDVGKFWLSRSGMEKNLFLS